MVPPASSQAERLPRHDMLKSSRPSVAVASFASSGATNLFFTMKKSIFLLLSLFTIYNIFISKTLYIIVMRLYYVFCSYIPLKEKLCTSKLLPSSPKLIRDFFNRLVSILRVQRAQCDWYSISKLGVR
jgi:hypothetical protein